jgi:succinate dehydrogenase hydrophobic anchor subunit
MIFSSTYGNLVSLCVTQTYEDVKYLTNNFLTIIMFFDMVIFLVITDYHKFISMNNIISNK